MMIHSDAAQTGQNPSHHIAIQAAGLGKAYQITHQTGTDRQYRTLREDLMTLIRHRGRPRSRPQQKTIWALREVSLQVQRGEIVGLIGRNGAGKSTLLKLLARITRPTTGSADIFGRLGSLLEIGTGFHSELTGRENVFLSGAVLGMRRAEIRQRFDEIVAFAEIEPFIDTPVKRYSSGMYLRLAFAVAAHLDTEILLVDEVLAVGDGLFQRKSLGKMSAVAQEGRTVLFVSHNMVAVRNLCSRAIQLADGRKVQDGPVNEVIANYIKDQMDLQGLERMWDDPDTAPGSDGVRFRRISLRPESGDSFITTSTPLVAEFEYWNRGPDAYLSLSISVFTDQDIMVFNSMSTRRPVSESLLCPTGLIRSRCHIPGNLLNDGLHRLQVFVIKDQSHVLYRMPDALTFEITDSNEARGSWYGKWRGVIRPLLDWETEIVRIEEDSS